MLPHVGAVASLDDEEQVRALLAGLGFWQIERLHEKEALIAESEALASSEDGRAIGDALERLIRLLMNDAPPRIERFRLISLLDDIPLREFTALRAPAERSLVQESQIDLSNNVIQSGAPMQNTLLAAVCSSGIA